eukprot:jgi/Botrbrau1/15905/Bobra.40_1s0087.1
MSPAKRSMSQGVVPPAASPAVPRTASATSGDGQRMTRASVDKQTRKLRSGTTLPMAGAGAPVLLLEGLHEGQERLLKKSPDDGSKSVRASKHSPAVSMAAAGPQRPEGDQPVSPPGPGPPGSPREQRPGSGRATRTATARSTRQSVHSMSRTPPYSVASLVALSAASGRSPGTAVQRPSSRGIDSREASTVGSPSPDAHGTGPRGSRLGGTADAPQQWAARARGRSHRAQIHHPQVRGGVWYPGGGPEVFPGGGWAGGPKLRRSAGAYRYPAGSSAVPVGSQLLQGMLPPVPWMTQGPLSQEGGSGAATGVPPAPRD